jgi:hypothetical protein
LILGIDIDKVIVEVLYIPVSSYALRGAHLRTYEVRETSQEDEGFWQLRTRFVYVLIVPIFAQNLVLIFDVAMLFVDVVSVHAGM